MSTPHTEPEAPPDLVTLDQVKNRAPELSEEDATQLWRELNAAARTNAPCLAGTISDDVLIQATGILLRAITRQGAVSSWLESETIGPYSARYRNEMSASGILTSLDVAALRALCGTPTVGAPVASYEACDHYGYLFAQPRRFVR